MSEHSKIEWTDATWNPIRARPRAGEKIVDDIGWRSGLPGGRPGWYCEHESDGCRFCYAESMNRRLGTGIDFRRQNRDRVEIFLDENALLAPLHWKRPRRIFVCSMTDLFADFVPDEWIDRVFAVMALCPQHTFQVLTKRAKRMQRYYAVPDRTNLINGQIWSLLGTFCGSKIKHGGKWRCSLPLPNVWFGTSAEDQKRADERIPDLLAAPAAVRFVSLEPLLGPIDLQSPHIDLGIGRYGTHPDLDWVIVGGESGPKARPMHPEWVRSIHDQCASANVPSFFKQWGTWLPSTELRQPSQHESVSVCRDGRVREWDEGEGRLTDPEMRVMCRVGKKAAGRLLDGVEHNAFPDSPHTQREITCGDSPIRERELSA